MLIYKATLPSNKSYIGLTRETIEDRKKRHKESVDKKSKYAFHCAIRKYGWENVKWEIIEDNITDWNELIEKEKINIESFKTYTPNGYNMTRGGDGVFGLKHSEKTKRLMRKRKLDNPVWLGKHHSPESLEKMRNAHKGKIISQSQKDKLSKINEIYEYQLIDPYGNEYKTKSLNRFCIDNNLSRVCMGRLVSKNPKQKQHKGWTAKILRRLK